jgi:hypothetical protein
MYAMVDREDDLRIGIKSSAILFGEADRVIVGAMQLMTLYALWLAGKELDLGGWYRSGLAAAACFALYQQYLIRRREPDDCLLAFLNNNYFGMAVFVGVAWSIYLDRRGGHASPVLNGHMGARPDGRQTNGPRFLGYNARRIAAAASRTIAVLHTISRWAREDHHSGSGTGRPHGGIPSGS